MLLCEFFLLLGVVVAVVVIVIGIDCIPLQTVHFAINSLPLLYFLKHV
jgi:hypothetical protein